MSYAGKGAGFAPTGKQVKGATPYENASSGMNMAFQTLSRALRSNSKYPQQIMKGAEAFMNPYTEQVIDRSVGDVNEFRDNALRDNQASAAKAGAFGGSRHGVVDAITNREAMDTVADMSSGLRKSGWDSAVGNAMQGYETQFGQALTGAEKMAQLGNQFFNTGRKVTEDQMVQGQQAQQSQQAVLDRAFSMWNDYYNSPGDSLAARINDLTTNPLGGATTTSESSQAGPMDYVSMGLGTLASGYNTGSSSYSWDDLANYFSGSGGGDGGAGYLSGGGGGGGGG